jgi:hypothetical protein
MAQSFEPTADDRLISVLDDSPAGLRDRALLLMESMGAVRHSKPVWREV